MLVPPLNLETKQRDSFLAKVMRSRHIYAVAGEEGLARVPSKRFRGREVALLWSNREDADRWASVVAVNPRIKTLTLGEVSSGVLPGLAKHRRFVGLDWSSEPIEGEFDPVDLGERLRLAALDHFIASARETGHVWTLEDAHGPAMVVSQTRPDILILPCWSEAGEAVARTEGPWRNMMPMDIPVETFLSAKLVWLIDNNHLVAPEFSGGPGSLELDPCDLQARFAEVRKAPVPA